jgi:hypothetical protein
MSKNFAKIFRVPRPSLPRISFSLASAGKVAAVFRILRDVVQAQINHLPNFKSSATAQKFRQNIQCTQAFSV